MQVAKEDQRLREGLRKTINDGGNQMAIRSAAAQSAELSGMNYEMLIQVGLACLSFYHGTFNHSAATTTAVCFTVLHVAIYVLRPCFAFGFCAGLFDGRRSNR